MATALLSASLHVLAASVQPCQDGKRLLIRTAEQRPATFLFPPAMAAAIGRSLMERERSTDATIKAMPPGKAKYVRLADDDLVKYRELFELAMGKPPRGTVSKVCREKGIDPEKFWGWYAAERKRRAAA